MDQIKKLLLKKEFLNEEIASMNAKISAIDAELPKIIRKALDIQESHTTPSETETNTSVETEVLAEENHKEEKYIIEMECADVNKLIPVGCPYPIKNISAIKYEHVCTNSGPHTVRRNIHMTIHETHRRGYLSLCHGDEDNNQYVLFCVIASEPLGTGNVYVQGYTARIVCSGWELSASTYLPRVKIYNEHRSIV